MSELQTFLLKKNDQNNAAAKQCRKRTRRRKTAMFSMAAVGVIPFLAPPLGTDSSVFALAAVADSIDGLYGEDGQMVQDALIAAMIAENQTAGAAPGAGIVLGGNADGQYREAARRAVEELREATGSILGELAGQRDVLHLLELDGQESLFENDRVADDAALKAADGKSEARSESGAAEGGRSEEAGEEPVSGSASVAIGGAGVKVSAATNEAGTKALAAIGQSGTKATAAETKSGTKATAAVTESGTKATAAVTESGTKAVAESGTKVTKLSAKAAAEAEAAFYKKIDISGIPSALTLQYNAGYTSLKLSAEQLAVLETIVEAEAGDEDAYGKILVANVVLNRVLDEEFPDTVKEVVFQNNGKTYQFSPVRKGGRYYTVKVSGHTKAAVARALAGEDYSNGALYFFARRYTSEQKATWFDTALKRIVEYGCHEFFGNK